MLSTRLLRITSADPWWKVALLALDELNQIDVAVTQTIFNSLPQPEVSENRCISVRDAGVIIDSDKSILLIPWDWLLIAVDAADGTLTTNEGDKVVDRADDLVLPSLDIGWFDTLATENLLEGRSKHGEFGEDRWVEDSRGGSSLWYARWTSDA